MTRLLPSLFVAVALFVGASALAQDGSEAPPGERPVAEGEIVVTAQPEASPREFARAVESFVEDLGQPGPINRISRWGEAVCPRVAGLSQPFNDFVTARIKQIAADAGVPAAAECGDRANVLAIFTTKPQDVAADLGRNHKALLGFHYVGQTGSLAAFRPPMKAWYVTVSIIPGKYAAIDKAYAPAPPGTAGSRIHPPVQSRFAFVLILIDSNLLKDQAIGPVADKVAMLALSNPGAHDGCSPLPSVLDLLEPDCVSDDPADGLTDFDRSYLKALYAFDRDELKSLMRGEIADRIIAELGPLAGDAAGR
jgi:hypothetical protein